MKLLLVEDELRLARSLKKGLEEQGFIVDHTSQGQEGLQLAKEGAYDAIILDVLLPQKSGYEIVRELRAVGIKTPVLFLTAKGTVEERVEGLNLGADDYLVKPFAFSELVARLYALQRRRDHYQSHCLEVGDLRCDVLKREVWRGKRRIELRPKEFAILQYLMENQGRIVTRHMLLERVWDYSFVGGSNVVDVHVKRLRDKIEQEGEKRLLRTVKGVGYILEA